MASRSKNSKKRKNSSRWLLIVIPAIVGFFYLAAQGNTPTAILKQKQPQPIRIVFVGDIMLDRGVRGSVNKYLAGDYNKLFEHTGYISDADIAFANLEGPVGTSGRKVGSRFSFLMDPAGLTAMKNAGFDVVSFANNHVGDYSRTAFLETLTHLQENDIAFAGAGTSRAQAITPAVITVRGMRIGFLAATDVGPNWFKATEDTPGILIASDPALSDIIQEARTQVDVLVMSFHWGNEYSPANSHQRTLAHMAIDSGVDIVVGHHPHVMEEVEWYKEKPIFYSLGNFIFDQYFSEHTLRGMVAEVSIDAKTHAITATEYVSPQNKQYVPQERIPFDSSLLITKPFTP